MQGKYFSIKVHNELKNNWIYYGIHREDGKDQLTKLIDEENNLIAPSQTKLIPFELLVNNIIIEERADVEQEECVEIPFSLWFGETKEEDKMNNQYIYDMVLKLRCRKTTQSFVFTYLDHDFSISQGIYNNNNTDNNNKKKKGG